MRSGKRFVRRFLQHRRSEETDWGFLSKESEACKSRRLNKKIRLNMSKQYEFKSFEEMKSAIRAGRKYARENGTPEDPNKVSKPAELKEQVSKPEDYACPTTDVENDANIEPAVDTPLQELGADESDIDPENGNAKEDAVSATKEAAAKVIKSLHKLTDANIKAASGRRNIAADVDTSALTLSKIAKSLNAVERGAADAYRTQAQAKAQAMKVATLRELMDMNSLYNTQSMLARKAGVKRASANDSITSRLIKLAMAAGEADAAAMASGAPLPQAEAPEVEQQDIMAVLQELVANGMLDEESAAALAQVIALVQSGQLPPEILDQLLSGGAAPVPADPAAAAAPMDPAMAGGVPPMDPSMAGAPAAKMASTLAKFARKSRSGQLAGELYRTAVIFKRAAAEAGAVEDPEVSLDDLDTVICEAEDSGAITPEQAEEVREVIADEVADTAEEAAIAEAMDEEADAAALEDAVADEADIEEAAAPEDISVEEVEVAPEVGDDDEISEEEFAQALVDAGVTPEEVEEAVADLAAEAEAEALGDDDEISEEEFAQALLEEGVTPEELEEAIASLEAEGVVL